MIKKSLSASRFLTPVLAEDLCCEFPRTRSAELAYIPRPSRSRNEADEAWTVEPNHPR
jgi:hypothetical protein